MSANEGSILDSQQRCAYCTLVVDDTCRVCPDCNEPFPSDEDDPTPVVEDAFSGGFAENH